MGNWKLEVFRMALYMSFPVSLFYLYNSPFYVDYLKSNNKNLYPSLDPESKKKCDELMQKGYERKEKELMKKMEENSK